MKKMLKDAYAYGLIPNDIRKELMDVRRKVPKIQLLSTSELQLLLQEAAKHPECYFEILLGLFPGFDPAKSEGFAMRTSMQKAYNPHFEAISYKLQSRRLQRSLSEVWKNVRTQNDPKVGEEELILPFSGADYMLVHNKV